MGNTKHPSILVTPEINKELLEGLTKKELIEEVEWLKRQNDELIKMLQAQNSRLNELELIIEKETDINLEFPGKSKHYRKRS
mgnify:CR=1 FL=1